MAPSTVYKPTSLDFINRPNPVEPQSVPQHHPLDGVPQISQVSNKDILRLLYGNSNAQSSVQQERLAKRRKSGDVQAQSLDLPKLPVRQNAKRLRIPPTLSGLHQPPPDAGLLPSISVEQPAKPARDPPPEASPPRSGQTGTDEQVNDKAASTKTIHVPRRVEKSKRPKRKKWSDEETACLLKGVAKFGVGNWTKILTCSENNFNSRTALDLKDRFRVCCPDDYKHKTTAGAQATPSSQEQRRPVPRPNRRDCKSQAELAELGINQPFDKVARRARHGYSEAEDEALLRGFRLYGKQWSSIRADSELGLEHRTATDLRDRMRTRYPAEYAEAGLMPKPDGKAMKLVIGNGDESMTNEVSAKNVAGVTKEVAAKSTTTIELNDQAKQLNTMPLLPDDVFFGAAFDSDFDPGPITLDRGILDWPQPQTRTMIDPIATLNLPRPTATATWPQPGSNTQQPQQFPAASALPSLAAITNYGYGFDGMMEGDQLELPSLMNGPFDTDARGGGHIFGIDELLS